MADSRLMAESVLLHSRSDARCKAGSDMVLHGVQPRSATAMRSRSDMWCRLPIFVKDDVKVLLFCVSCKPA